MRKYGKKRNQILEVIARKRELRQRPEAVAKRKQYSQTPHALALKSARERERKARKLNQLGIVTNQVETMLEIATHCAICSAGFTKKRPKHIDHVTPLVKGGTHDNGNLQALCQSCNNKKYDKDPIAFARRFGRLL